MPSRVYRIFKNIPYFDGGTEEISNVYRYSHPGLGNQVSQEDAVATIDALLQLEKTVHSPDVTFTRAESANVGALDGTLFTDVEVEFEGVEKGTATASGGSWSPTNCVMLQQRVGKRRWLRKFLHTFSLTVDTTDSVFRTHWSTGDGGWTALLNYATELWNLTVNINGSDQDLTYEAGNGTASTGPWEVDDRIRWHDLRY